MNLRQIEILKPAPILNTPDFSSVFGGTEIPLDAKGHPHHFEFIALPGMQFTLIEEKNSIYQVLDPNYSSAPLFVDARFVGKYEKKNQINKSKGEILAEMKKLLGTRYVWGGNWSFGIPEMLEYYPPIGKLEEQMEAYWTWRGVDCSGLLFQVMNGLTPRNTSKLVHWGNELSFANLKLDEILPLLEPLDMIVYPGHILFVLDRSYTIESKSPFGVIQRNLRERLNELISERTIVNRWEKNLDPQRCIVFRRFPL